MGCSLFGTGFEIGFGEDEVRFLRCEPVGLGEPKRLLCSFLLLGDSPTRVIGERLVCSRGLDTVNSSRCTVKGVNFLCAGRHPCWFRAETVMALWVVSRGRSTIRDSMVADEDCKTLRVYFDTLSDMIDIDSAIDAGCLRPLRILSFKALKPIHKAPFTDVAFGLSHCLKIIVSQSN